MPRRAARKKPPSYIERSARRAGATISEPPTASQLLVWEPEQHVEGSKAQQRQYWLDGGIWYAGNCLSATAPGERAAIYETGKGGVIGFWDFSGHAAADETEQASPDFPAAGAFDGPSEWRHHGGGSVAQSGHLRLRSRR